MFDIDNTVMRGASMFHFARGALREHFITVRDLFKFARMQWRFIRKGEIMTDVHEIQARALQVIAGRSEQEVLQMVGPVYNKYLAKRIRPQVVQLFEHHKAQGHQMWLASATPVQIASKIAEEFGLDGTLGTKVIVKDGLFTGEIDGKFLHAQAKADAFNALAEEQNFDLLQSFAYSDSINDLPLLESVGNPICVNPDLKLATIATQRLWPKLRFTKHFRKTKTATE